MDARRFVPNPIRTQDYSHPTWDNSRPPYGQFAPTPKDNSRPYLKTIRSQFSDEDLYTSLYISTLVFCWRLEIRTFRWGNKMTTFPH